jgi:peptidoglycan L-alanyl-D-glutamate endopeptidase CwlK
MPSFGANSKRHLKTLHPDLKEVLNEAIKHFDFSIVWGFRGEEAQTRAYLEGNSLVEWPNSRHNSQPAEAVDVVPWPGGFDNDDETFYKMATYILRAASLRGVRLSWGGHWTSLKDLAHFELTDRNGHG